MIITFLVATSLGITQTLTAHSNRRSFAPTMCGAEISKCDKHRSRGVLSAWPKPLYTLFAILWNKILLHKTRESTVQYSRYDIIEMRVPGCIVRCTCQSFVNLTPVWVTIYVSAKSCNDGVNDADNELWYCTSSLIMQKELRGNGRVWGARSRCTEVDALWLIRPNAITHRFIEVRQDLPCVQRSDALPLLVTSPAKTRNNSLVTN